MRLGRPATALFLVMAGLLGVLVAWTLGGTFGASGGAPTTVGIDFNTGDNTATSVGAITTCLEVPSGGSYTFDVYVQNIPGDTDPTTPDGMIGGQFTLNSISGNTLTARSVTAAPAASSSFIDTNPSLSATGATIDSGASTALANSTGSDTPVSSNENAIGGTGATGDGWWVRMTYTAPTVPAATIVTLTLTNLTLNTADAGELAGFVTKPATLVVAPDGTTNCVSVLATPTPSPTPTPTATPCTTSCPTPTPTPTATPTPLAANGNTGADAISAGAAHTCVVKNGGAWCWGENFYGALGDGTRTDSSVPVAVSGLGSGVSAISAGFALTCVVKNGGAWCWGENLHGALGDGTSTGPGNCPYGGLLFGAPCSTVPVAVSGLGSGVSAISTGDLHTCALKDGGVWCWGSNYYGALGDGTRTDSSVPVAVSGLGSGVSAISAGSYHTCALKDGGAWCWGGNGIGELGNGTTTDSSVPVAVSGLGSGVSAISAGFDHACALKDGSVWCWGANFRGELGNGTTTGSSVPVAVSGLGSGVSAISAGTEYTCAVTSAGGAWCWGENVYGALGDGTTTDSSVPVAVSGLGSGVSAISAGSVKTCALKDGGAWCWGYNGNGQLGDGTTTNSSVPVAVSGLGTRSSVSAISAGGAHTCALKDGGVWCWGNNNNGELGDGTTTHSSVPVAVSGLGSAVSAISAGGDHTCALKDGGVWCWGFNYYGQLGDGTTTDSSAPVAVSGLGSGVSAISAGEGHTCALKDGGAWCWGKNGSGELGDGTNSGPESCHGFYSCSTVPVAVSGLGSGVSAVSAGGAHTCALKDGGAWCWGSNVNGELGDGTTTDNTVPVAVSGLGSGVSAVSAGEGHTCALKDGGAWCWGSNYNGELGDGTTTYKSVPVAVSGLGSGVSAVSADAGHTCALKDGGVWCWGYNFAGELGDGTTTDSSVPVAVSGLGNGVSGISAGASYTCALKDGGVWCWGVNGIGQLGDGTTTNSSVPIEVSGLVSASGTVSASGGTVSTGTTATAADPVETSVTVPAGTVGGTVSISEQPVNTQPPSGFSFFGQQVVITAPAATADNPLVLAFHIDASLIPPSANENTIAIFKDGVQVPNCSVFPGSVTAAPNPCVSNRTWPAGGNVEVIVLTSTASNWNFGAAAPNTATFTVTKVYTDGNTTAAVSVHLACTSGGVGDNDQSVIGGGTLTFHVSSDVPPDSCTASESGVPAGYTSDSPCTGDITGAPSGSGGCTITNTLNTATFTVSKVYSDSNTAPVTVTIGCVSGHVQHPVDQASPGHPVVFTVTGIPADGTTCTATEETAPGGYTETDTCHPAGGVPLAATGTASCTITNTLNSATITVHKVYVGADGGSVTITLTCSGATTIVSPPGTSNVGTATVIGGGTHDFTVTGFDAGDSCTASEDPVSGYTEVDNCTSANLALTAGGTASCTITNTQEPDLTVAKTTSTAVVAAGGTGKFKITTSNLGPSTANGLTTTDTLPAGLSWSIDAANTDATSNADCLILGNVLTCSYGSQPSGFSSFVTVQAITSTLNCGTVANNASVSATNEWPGTLANDTATASFSVTCGAGRHDVGVPKGGFNVDNSVHPGQKRDVHIHIKNFGTVTETQVGYRVVSTCASAVCHGTMSLAAACTGTVGPLKKGQTVDVHNCRATPSLSSQPGDVWKLTLMVIHCGVDGGPPCTTSDGASDANTSNNLAVRTMKIH